MHVAMYSIQSSFCTECPLPSSSDTDLICAGDFVQPLASLLCLGGVEVSGPGRVLEDRESSLLAKPHDEGHASRCGDCGGTTVLIYDGLHAEMCTCRAASPGAHWWNREDAPHSCSSSEFRLCRDDVPHGHKKMLNQRSAAAHWPPNNGSEASWKLWLDGEFCSSDFCPFQWQQGHCGPPTDVHSVFIIDARSDAGRGFTRDLVCSECGVETSERLHMTIREESISWICCARRQKMNKVAEVCKKKLLTLVCFSIR